MYVFSLINFIWHIKYYMFCIIYKPEEESKKTFHIIKYRTKFYDVVFSLSIKLNLI